MSGDTYGCHSWEATAGHLGTGAVLVLSIVSCRGQFLQQRVTWPRVSVGRAELGKLWSKVSSYVSYFYSLRVGPFFQ